MVNFRTEKAKFLATITAECDPEVLTAVSLGIGFLAKNHTSGRNIPIVLCSYSTEYHQSAAALLARFCRQVQPSIVEGDPYFTPNMLHLSCETTQQSLVQYCNLLREYGPSQFYWADHINWFKNMPSEMFYVIDFNGREVVGGLNNGTQVDEQPEILSDDDDGDVALEQLSGLINMASPSEDIQMQFYREAGAGIVRIITAPEGECFDPVITSQSPDWQREACVALRRYLARECGYSMQWDASAAGWRGVEVHTFIAHGVPVLDRNITSDGLVGFATFCDDGVGGHYLSSTWIHPFHRRKNLLANAWHGFVDRYGQFTVDQPSANMQAFLKKIGHQGKFMGALS